MLAYRRLIRAVNYPYNMVWINSQYEESEGVARITVRDYQNCFRNEFHTFTVDDLIDNLLRTGFKGVVWTAPTFVATRDENFRYAETPLLHLLWI